MSKTQNKPPKIKKKVKNVLNGKKTNQKCGKKS